jgi:GLPGLI family protein
MKKFTITLLVAVFAFVAANAQMKEGKIVYERKINMWKMITDPEMRTRIPEFRTSEFELLFNDQASLFRNVPEDEAPDPFANSGGGGERGGQRFAFRMPETTTYTNIVSQMQYESRPMFEKTFLVVDSLMPLKWKISEETKTIAKHVCKKATTTITAQNVRFSVGGGGARGMGRNNGDTTNKPTAAIAPKETEVVVWYAEDIAASVGPDNYTGLPGAILEVDVDNGSNVTTATEVTTKYPKKELVEPTKGDKMNKVQFQDAMKKLLEDMQRGGGMRIRMGNN